MTVTYVLFPLWLVLASILILPTAMFIFGFICGMKSGRKNFKIRAERLWQHLDNIDTLSDISKGNTEYFYNHTLEIVKKRFDLAYSDGYKLEWKPLKKKEENEHGSNCK